MHVVYILSNIIRSVLYIGVTSDLASRIQAHRDGVVEGFTKRYRCRDLVYMEVFEDRNEALEREKQLKGWRREKKDALIRQQNPYFADLTWKLE